MCKSVIRQSADTPGVAMKFLVVLALSGLALAEPEAEADPALLYAQYGYGGYGLHPSVYRHPRFGLHSAYAAYNPYRAIPAFHYRGKREADAEADPQLLLDGRIKTFHLPQDVRTVYNTAIPQVQALPVQNLSVLTTKGITGSRTVTTNYNTVIPQVQALTVQNLPVQTVFNTAIPEKVVYPQTPLLKTADHTVVATPAGYVHSSHVGLCTNNMGVAVPC